MIKHIVTIILSITLMLFNNNPKPNTNSLIDLRQTYVEIIKTNEEFLDIINESEDSPSVIQTRLNIKKVKEAIIELDRSLSQ